jgi:CMP-N,N'-diacetyllegionaminic acid synthase
MKYSQKKTIGIIPARGGSKGLPGKNIRDLHGKPLIAWTIEAAINSVELDDFVVTTDSEDILKVAKQFGCKNLILRPPELATDEMTLEPVIEHVISSLEEKYTHVLLLQPTSPLRTSNDIDGILKSATNSSDVPIIGVTKSSKSPYISYTLDDEGLMSPLFPGVRRQRRQDMPITYVPNGALYFSRIDTLIEAGTFVTPDVHAYVMSEERSVDIDSELDLMLAELLLSKVD